MTMSAKGTARDLVLVTGSSGLIGRALIAEMKPTQLRPVPFDIRETASHAFGDLRDDHALERATADVTGIIHLGGMSRVVWGERDPELCWALNVEATRKLLTLACRSALRPWFIYASSREVYGQQSIFPVAEDATLHPLNVYARSKTAAEELMAGARECGLATAVVRFSSVYGDIQDHEDRVVPAFARAAVKGGTIRLDGSDCAFDFTHAHDVAAGLIQVSEALSSGERRLPTLHFVSGVSTTLRELAEMATTLGGRPTQISMAKPRAFDIHSFRGDPSLATSVLGWRATTPLKMGLSRLIEDFKARNGTDSKL